MLSAFFGGLLLAYAGMVGLCQGLERHHKQVWQRVPTPRLRRGLRLAGWVLLAASFAACVAAWGWAMGPVGWFGQICLAGFTLVLLLPYWPRLALFWPLPASLVLGIAWVVGG
ncbi:MULTISPECIES: DUF3325 domain-containing protein [unclassified Pseudomonas]|uniref:DUF3325 domain-containing protein n=1 Tax=unclassified Pseudomonas TaxID=196821 RepID=UPI00244A76DC|nr:MULTISPECIES: DUF3325 domain-containing protein [unclassified Pseudomonas]MDG9924982.1 DUF3325 domain-containing protein [Pseudomonas sp. GD04045]MDH0036263.1 DUF3325 domain-containing protein [Pseudomonas sp. GD04019]